MTIWDNIYKNYQGGGEAWATISEEIHPLFKTFLEQAIFDLKYAFDIGCGTGKYLKFLQAGGFKTDGIDSSETAVEMTKRLLNDNSIIHCVNMYDFGIPVNKYDLVISISTIHHGTKKQIQDLINKIYAAIVENGRIFITLPNYNNIQKWDTYKNYKEIVSGTFVPLSGPETGLSHSFFTKQEIQQLFSKFINIQLNLDNHERWFIQASK